MVMRILVVGSKVEQMSGSLLGFTFSGVYNGAGADQCGANTSDRVTDAMIYTYV